MRGHLHTIDHAAEMTHEWVRDLSRLLDWTDEQSWPFQAVHAERSDSLVEAVHCHRSGGPRARRAFNKSCSSATWPSWSSQLFHQPGRQLRQPQPRGPAASSFVFWSVSRPA